MAPNPVRPVVVIAMLPVDALLVLKLLFSVTAPPKIVIGPAILVDPPIVTSAVLVALPSVKPLMDVDRARLDIVKLNALTKLLPEG